MKKSPVLFIGIIIVFSLFITTLGCTTETNFDPTTYEGLVKILNSDTNVLLIDVRTAEEFASGYIPGALNIPYDVILENLPDWEKDDPIILYCRSGNRAGIALTTLTEAGYTRVYNFGGVSNWQGELNTPESRE